MCSSKRSRGAGCGALLIIAALAASAGCRSSSATTTTTSAAATTIPATTTTTQPYHYTNIMSVMQEDALGLDAIVEAAVRLDALAGQPDGTTTLVGDGRVETKRRGDASGVTTVGPGVSLIAFVAARLLPQPHPTDLCELITGTEYCRIGLLSLNADAGGPTATFEAGRSAVVRVDTTARHPLALPGGWAAVVQPLLVPAQGPDLLVAIVVPGIVPTCTLYRGEPVVAFGYSQAGSKRAEEIGGTCRTAKLS